MIINPYTLSGFNVLTDLPWDALWIAGINTWNTGTTDPAANGETVENWGDAIANTKFLTQATSGSRPVYRTTSAPFSANPTINGDGTADFLQWNRGSTLAAPYTVVVIGAHQSGATTYTCLAADSANALFFPWLLDDSSALYESAYTSGTYFFGNGHNSNANLWHTVVAASGATASRFGRGGLPAIGQFDATALSGLRLFVYPTANAFYGSGHVALIGILPAAAASYSNWWAFLRWAETTFTGVKTTSVARILIDGDSRAQGANNTYPAAAGYITDRAYELQWGSRLQNRFTDATQVVGFGKSGRTMATQNAEFSTYIGTALSESIGAKKIAVCINAGYNDVIAGETGAQAYARVCTWVDAAHAAGALALIGTAAPATGIGSAANTRRIDLNVLILANAGSGGGNGIADGVADIANDANTTAANPFAFTASPPVTPHNTVNFNADYTHWSATGNVIIADMIETALAASPFSVT